MGRAQAEEVGRGYSGPDFFLVTVATDSGLPVQKTGSGGGRRGCGTQHQPPPVDTLPPLLVGEVDSTPGQLKGQLPSLRGSHGLNRHRLSCQESGQGATLVLHVGLESAGQS